MTEEEFKRRLNPELKADIEAAQTKVLDDILDPAICRDNRLYAWEVAPGVKLKKRRIPGLEGDPDIYAIQCQPADKAPDAPAILFLMGSAYCTGCVNSITSYLIALARETGAVVIAPNYRLAPEDPYPAAFRDCYSTLLWMDRSAEALGYDRDRLAVAGISAGGGLTIALCLYIRDHGGPKIRFQMPLYPMIDDRLETVSSREINDPYVLNRASCEQAWLYYLGEGHKERDIPIYAAPARAADLRGLPPCYSFVGELDPLRDETLDYVARLVRAGVPTGFSLYGGCVHGFEFSYLARMYCSTGLSGGQVPKVVRAAVDEAMRALRSGLAKR